jgi:hypothetical protein
LRGNPSAARLSGNFEATEPASAAHAALDIHARRERGEFMPLKYQWQRRNAIPVSHVCCETAHIQVLEARDFVW